MFFEEETLNDSNILFILLVLLMLYNSRANTLNDKDNIVWRNSHSPSTKYCRPVSIECKKKTLFIYKIRSRYYVMSNHFKELTKKFKLN